MLQPKPHTPDSAPHRPPVSHESAPPLFGAIDCLLVDNAGEFAFDGAVRRAEANALWTWLKRDIAPDLIDEAARSATPAQALERLLPVLLTRARAARTVAAPGSDAERRLERQLGGRDLLQRLPVLLDAVKGFPLLDKAEAFGRALNGIEEEAALVAALQSVPRHDAGMAALLMMAAMGQVAQPARVMAAAIRIAGDPTETALVRAGFAPLIEALLAHAQNAVPAMRPTGLFADVDLACRAVERFHRLLRSVTAQVELVRPGRSATIVAALTRTVSERLAPRLRNLVPDITQSLRRRREGEDRLDDDRLLAALNGSYLLTTVRACRDSLALNEILDETWTRTGQLLELQLERVLEALREAPGDPIALARVEAGIKMAENRFGVEYADILRRARDGIGRRLRSA